MRKTRILGIAPYEGMRVLMNQLADQMEDVELTSFVGDMEAGAEIAERYAEQEYDVVLSRGGTAELIRSKICLPVIEVELSLYDLLRSMHLAEISNRQCALVGFPAITRNATFLCDVMNYRIDLYTIHDEKEARLVLKCLAENGCQMVLCDMITNSLAHEFGLPALLITSGSESVETAIRQAVTVNRSFYSLRQKALLTEAILELSNENRIVINEEGEITYQTGPALPEELIRRCADWVPAVLQSENRSISFTSGGKQYHLSGRALAFNHRSYACFRIRSSYARMPLDKYGIRFLTREEVTDHYFNSFYGVTQPGSIHLYEECAEKGISMIIVGEQGTGKEQMARLQYSSGKYRNNPLCIIDCALLQDKGWTYLMENELSPLAGEGFAVHFKNVEALPFDRFLHLFSLLRDIQFHRKNQLLFTSAVSVHESLPEWVSQIAGWFDCMVISLPLLSEHREEIPHLATLYISMLNATNAREVAMIEPEAIRMLMEYDWPANYDQFMRILREIVLQAEGVSVKTELVSRLLKKEKMFWPDTASESFGTAIQGKSMDEIELMAVRQALADANGNRTAAADRLGISRTSLWRMIQRLEDS